MDKINEKLKEYGLEVLDIAQTEKTENIKEILVRMSQKTTYTAYRSNPQLDLYVLMSNYLYIYVADVETFKRAFNVSSKFDKLFEWCITEFSLGVSAAGMMKPYRNWNDATYETKVVELIEKMGEDYWKKNKTYALKKTFDPQHVFTEIGREQAELTKNLEWELYGSLEVRDFQLEFQRVGNEVWAEIMEEKNILKETVK